MVANVSALAETMNRSNHWASSPSFNGSVQHPSVNFNSSHRLAAHATYVDSAPPPPSMNAATLVAPGQDSLLGVLFSLSQSPDVYQPLQHAPDVYQPLQHAQHALNLITPSVPYWSSPGIELQDDAATYEDDDSEGAVSVTCRQLVLDKKAASNALPFLLQSYAAWIERLALDPQKVADIARGFVFSHFEDGDQSRWIIALLGNIGGRMGGTEHLVGAHNPMRSMLQNAVQRRLRAVKSCPDPERHTLVKALDCAIETTILQFHIGSLGEAMIIRHEAASIFRKLCPEPHGAPIYLSPVLQHPVGSLRRFAQMDVVFSAIMDIPTLFRYEAVIPGSLPANPYQSVTAIQCDGIVQWLHGIPNEIVLSLARMKTMRQDGVIPNAEMVASLEQDIHQMQSCSNSTSDRFRAIIRFVIHECWRQAAYIYLYMAVCGDPADTLRVQEYLRRYMKLLNATNPGRLPDEFLMLTLEFVFPAAIRQCDREAIRRRVLGIYERDRTYIADNFVILVMDDTWGRADAEGRPAMWSDVAMSRTRVLGL
ncbi:unnamed protein product [Rhizoctonia solani]|uniref:Uncharacterized protein n=1 Tax=Rhizoctonia solani TaxID=456999 RepID=A0A8H3D154_9AGAM|nr:unnamed protein product [Rhizoctonia solani]